MNIHRPELHPMAQAALVEIQGAGVTITPDIVLWVHDAATRIRKTPLRSACELVDWPVACGGELLYPLTFGAVDWLMRCPKEMRSDSRVIAWAMAQYKRPEAFAGLSVIWATHQVRKWTMRLSCSPDALAAAVDEVMGTEQYVEVKDVLPRKRDADSWQWDSVVRALCTKYPGTSPEYWTWEVSREKCYAMIQTVNDELPDESKITDYEIESNAAFRSVVEHIKATCKAVSDG